MATELTKLNITVPPLAADTCADDLELGPYGDYFSTEVNPYGRRILKSQYVGRDPLTTAMLSISAICRAAIASGQ